MKKGMLRKGAVAIAIALGMTFAGSASATIYYVSGTVQLLMGIDSGFGPNDDWFSLNGVGPQGACGAGGVGSNMAAAVKDDNNGQRQWALILAAKNAGTVINLRVDDTFKNGNGVCYAEYIW
jgi:hypothetical protein